MKEYIDKEDAIRAIGQFKKGFRHMKERCAINGCMLEIMALPLAADVVERKHGEWAVDKEDLEQNSALKRIHCTNCKKRPYFDREKRVFVLTAFCPHCGADMRKKEDT